MEEMSVETLDSLADSLASQCCKLTMSYSRKEWKASITAPDVVGLSMTGSARCSVDAVSQAIKNLQAMRLMRRRQEPQPTADELAKQKRTNGKKVAR